MTAANLLVELFVEELPPKALKKLGESFAALISESLVASGLAAAGAAVTPYATPRRLAVQVAGVLPKAADRATQIKLMPVSVGLDAQGAPTPALKKKLASLGLAEADTARCQRVGEGKAASLVLDSTVPGATLADGLQKALNEVLARLPIPKVMQYQLADGWSSVNFVRPAHGLVALHGAQVVPVSLLGLQSGRVTCGHRFEAAKAQIELRDADSYAAQLRDEGAVIASFAERRASIVAQLAAAAGGLKPIDDEALLDEVTALVERPKVLACQFEPEFLAVPQECLILTMKANQKYFPLLDAAGKLTHKFLIVSNINPADPSRVVQGNERVVRPRLADAKFFFDQDRKKTLASRVPGLDKVVYHGALGHQGERAARVQAIGHAIVSQLRMATLPYTAEAKDEFDVLDSKVREAAQLAKTDLLTDMVGEFPELQGVMGGYYARHEGLRDGVAIAIEDHYKPRFAGDALPRNHTGTVVALADKLETLVGLFGIGQLPTGDKDPFALRRHALGVIRILIEKNLPLELPELLKSALPAFGSLIKDPSSALLEFFEDRLSSSLREQGFTAHEVDAVLALGLGRLGDIPRRLEAVRDFSAMTEAGALAAANKRVSNILKKSELDFFGPVDPSRFTEEAEKSLHTALLTIRERAEVAYRAHDYKTSLRELAGLREPVDKFFDKVMVNDSDARVRENRLSLLGDLRQTMNQVADLSRLAS